MGNQIMGRFRKDRYMGFSEDQVEYLRYYNHNPSDKWELVKKPNQDELDVDKLAETYNISRDEADKVQNIISQLYKFMDVDESKSVSFYQFKVGVALLCQNPLSDSIRFLFQVYDIKRDKVIDEQELLAFTRSLYKNIAYYEEQPMLKDAELAVKNKALLTKWDFARKEGNLNEQEFNQMLTKDPDILNVLFKLGLANKDELTIEATHLNDIDSDVEIEMERRLLPRDERIERIKNGIEHNETAGGSDEFGIDDEEKEPPIWKSQFAAPSKVTDFDNSPPNAILDLDYVYGYRCHDTRNNLKYGNKGQIVYHTAGVGIVMDSNQNQKHYLEHNDDISCLDVFDNLVLTGQVGMTPILTVWDMDTMRMVCIWKDQFKNGISNCCFSNDGKSVSAVGLDDDHSVGVFDVEEAIRSRADHKSKSIGLIAFGKLTKEEVFDIKFCPGDWQILVAGMKEVHLLTWKNGQVLADKCIWKENHPQPVLTIGFIDGFFVTGMFSGNFFVWKKNVIEKTVKAHVTPVKAMHTRSAGRGIISADKRGIIMIWDSHLNKLGEIDVKDLKVKLIQEHRALPNVIAVCENPEGKILFGTRRSEIVELQPWRGDNSLPAGKVMMQGHYKGELWGLDVHPTQGIFYTVGEDELLAQWDIKQKRIIKSVSNTYEAKTMAVSPNGRWVCTGCVNGRVFIYDSNTLKQIAKITEIIDPDKEIVSMVKFSPNSETLIVTYNPPYALIVAYSTKTWKRQAEFTKCYYNVLAIDFTTDGKYFQINTSKYSIEYFSLDKDRVEAALLKDAQWATWTCMFGWPVQGIWPPCSDGADINAVDRSKDCQCIATADDFGKVKLMKFPCPKPNSGSVKYSGHSSLVLGVKFSYDGQYLLSIGGDELSIMQWRYVSSPSKLDLPPDEVPEQTQEIQIDIFEQEELDKGDQAGAVKPFLGEVQHSIPSWFKPNKARDDQLPKGNLSVHHIFGFRYFYILDECRDMLGWTDKGKVAFAAAALGVEMDPKTSQQSFFNKHEEDIVSFAMHPKRNICATGQMAQAGKAKCIDIYVWDIDTKEVLAHFNQFHLRAIVLLKFSPDGSQLLSVGQDDDNSLAINDWQANRQKCTSNVCKAKVNGAAWKSEDEFVTVGMKHIKFWKITGRNVQGTMGQQPGKFESQFACTYAFNNAVCVTGSGEGNIFAWKGGSADKPIKAHEGKVGSLKFEKNVLYSAGMDGKVISWGYEGGQLVKKQEIANLSAKALFPAGIVAMDIDAKGTFLLGTVGAQIYSYEPASKKSTLVTQGHYGEELWAACAAPKGNQFVTGGGDKTVRLWDIDTKKMIIASKPFPAEIRGVDWAMDGKFICCGDLNGFVYLLDPNTLQVLDTAKTIFTTMPKRQSTYWIEDLKISPDCKKVAFGAHGAASHVEEWGIQGNKFIPKPKKINAGLTSALLHIDWNTASSLCCVISQAYELKFVDMGAAKNARSSACADEEWATWTCKFGFPVQGIFPSADYSDVNTVCRSNSKKYLATGEDSQRVVLFQYPVVVTKQKRKEYIGHSSHVTRVRFTADDGFLISTGGNDKSVIIWKTDFGGGPQVNHKELCSEEGSEGIDVPKKKVPTKAAPKKAAPVKQEEDLFETAETDEGDQFMACKPWMGAIKEPTYSYYNDKQQGHKPPKCQIEIEYVYGYRSKDMRNNVYVLADGKLLYNAAALGIILDTKSNTQTFFDKHDDDITAIDLHPDRKTVATGELGAKPSIYIWDSDTKNVKCQFKAPLQKGIVALAFTPSGKRLVGTAIDVDHCCAVFDVSGKGSVVWTDKGGPEVIVDLRWATEDQFVTVGVKHFKLWKVDGAKALGTKGQFGKDANNNLSGIAINGNDTLCGAADGSVQIWRGNNFMKNLPSKHAQCCDAITITKDYVFTGGRDGTMFILSKTYEQIQQVNCKELLEDSVCASVRAIYADIENSTLYVGTLGSEIFQLSWKGNAITNATNFTVTNHMRGHYCPNLQWTNEVWGLDLFREDPDKFVTCSDDATVRVFSISERKQISLGRTLSTQDGGKEVPDLKTGDFTDKCKARVVACNPNDDGFTVGMKDGTVRLFDKGLSQHKVFKQAKEWISDIKFSPDGTTICIGSHDNAIYAYKWPSMKPIGNKMNKHSSYITHFDYSCDGVNLHSTCGAYELLFWDVAKCKQLPGGASALKDERWHTWTVTLGWPVQGIWPECADGTDINMVDRSHSSINNTQDPKDYFLLASGDDFGKVRILRYPSLKKSSEAVSGRGHSSHVTSVKWTQDDQRIISTGGEDQCVIQWKVTKK